MQNQCCLYRSLEWEVRLGRLACRDCKRINPRQTQCFRTSSRDFYRAGAYSKLVLIFEVPIHDMLLAFIRPRFTHPLPSRRCSQAVPRLSDTDQWISRSRSACSDHKCKGVDRICRIVAETFVRNICEYSQFEPSWATQQRLIIATDCSSGNHCQRVRRALVNGMPPLSVVSRGNTLPTTHM
jgi:hypothetical protein